MSAVQPGQRALRQSGLSRPSPSRVVRSALSRGGDFVAIELAFLMALALLVSGGSGEPSGGRILFGLLFVLFLPGYSLQAALFPRPADLDRSERLGLSLGLSVAVLPPLALALDALPWGLQLWPVALGLSSLVLPCATVALVRRARLAPVERPDPESRSAVGTGRGPRDLAGRILLVGFALALLVAGGSAALALATPDPADQFTEFYILGPHGLAESYPRVAVAGRPLSTTVGIANHEGAEQVYRVVVKIGGQVVGESYPIYLAEGAVWEGPVESVVIGGSDLQEVAFILERGNLPEPYRALSLRLNVQPHDSSPPK